MSKQVLFAMLALGVAVWAQDNVPQYPPTKTEVALLPAANAMGTKGDVDEMILNAGYDAAAKLMEIRNFKMIPFAKVQDVFAELKIANRDHVARSESFMKRVGEMLGADLVISTTVLEAKTQKSSQLLGSRKVGKARVKVWVYDAKQGKTVVLGEYAGESRGKTLASDIKRARDRRAAAVQDAVAKGLEKFLAPYAVDPKKRR
jgi:hypothetical protein